MISRSGLVVSGVSKRFESRGQLTKVFESLSFAVEQREFLSILGPTGCGKTTLLHLIAGFLTPDEGEIILNGRQIDGPDRNRAMIFQDDAVFPWYNTAENIGYGLRIRGGHNESTHLSVDELLREFDLVTERNKYPKEMSGGQRKRIDLARALATAPDVLLMDEPFASLDPITRESLCLYVSMVLAKRHTITLLVTHDVEEAIWMGDRVIILSNVPARLKRDYIVPFERPRALELRYSSRFQEIRGQLMEQLRV